MHNPAKGVINHRRSLWRKGLRPRRGQRWRVFIVDRFRHSVKNEDPDGFSSDRFTSGESWYENLEDEESAASEYFGVKTNE